MSERLTVALTVTLGGTEHVIPGGNVRGFSLEMTSFGVTGWVEFVVQDDEGRSGKYNDEVLADFMKPDLAEVSLSIEPARLDTLIDPSDVTLKTGGIVLERRLREDLHGRTLKSPATFSRYYRVSFADPARALWTQHFPCDLFTEKSFKDVIEAHKGEKATLTYDLDAITAPSPLYFFHLDPKRGCSFYDLVLWFVRENEGVFTFDHAEQTYSIGKAKDANGTAAALHPDDLASVTSVYPAIPRHKPRVLCSYTKATRTEVGDNENASKDVIRDILVRTPIAKQVDDRVTLENARPLLPGREVELTFARFPSAAMAPSSLVSLPAGTSSKAAMPPAEDTWRVYRLSVEASASDPAPDTHYGSPVGEFNLSITARLEAKEELSLRLPPSVEPTFPGYIEGTIVSEVGEDTDITYDIDTDQDTSVERYKVKIPLFGDQQIYAPYEPYSGGGMVYLPLYKGERVLVAFDFDKARIRELLDWRADAKVPVDGQGQHVFLGKSAKSNTSMLHDYQDEKPVLRFLRTNDKDTVLVKMAEGRLTLKVEEAKG